MCLRIQAFGKKPRLPPAAEKILDRRSKLDATVWADEVQSQRYARIVVQFWDSLRTAPDTALALLRVCDWDGDIDLPRYSAVRHLPHSIMQVKWAANPEALRLPTAAEPAFVLSSNSCSDLHAQRLLEDVLRGNYRIAHCEFHHEQFPPRTPTKLESSV